MSTGQLSEANLRKSFLPGADLMEADLSGADRHYADLNGAAVFDDEDLEQQAKSLEGATMPNGQKYENWLKDKKAQGKDENE
jgi:uncharacterized protein YjbI with pentapeptide repeats